ncbi:MAG: agmatinase [Pseudomonadota bacterium]
MSDHPSKTDLAFTRETGSGTVEEPTYSGALSFARRRYTKTLDGADVAVVGVPFDLATSSRPGARLGPRAIREASSMVAWDRVHEWDYDPFTRLSVIDYGDVYFNHGQPHTVPDAIRAEFAKIHAQHVKTLMLGGDHFASYPVLQALATHIGEPLALVHFDAHSDTWSEDKQSLHHGTMFYHAANEQLIAPEHSTQIGIRTYNEDSHGFNVISAERVRRVGVEVVIQKVIETVGKRPVYLTFDIDGIDPSMAPGTGTPVIGGLTTMEAQQILRGLRGINLVGADVVEVAPAYDVSQITALAAATMAMNLIGLFADAKSAI